MRRKLGQHFLTDKRIIHRILLAVNVTPQDLVLEIGPGRGCLTFALARQAKEFTAVEYDAELAQHLQQTFVAEPHVRILHADARTVQYADLFPDRERLQPGGVKVVANLPYYAAVPILFSLFQNIEIFSELTLMFQKEVAERITASPGCKAYGPLSIAAQYYTVPEYCFSIPPLAFHPRPKVMSAIVKLLCLPQPQVHLLDPDHFFALVKCAFLSRRKTLRNSLRTHGATQFPSLLVERVFEELHLPERIRGEQLSLQDFANLSNQLTQRMEKRLCEK